MVEESKDKAICFDYSHNNKLIIESSSYNDFTNYLFSSSFRIGQIKQGLTYDKLKSYDALIIGNPVDSQFQQEEIESIEKYVKEGGGLFCISDGGGNQESHANFSDLTEKFGFSFNSDIVHDSMMYIKTQDKALINKIELHYITKDVEQFVHSSGCSIKIDESIEADSNINIHILARSGLNTFIKNFDAEEIIEDDAPYSPILVALNYYKGRVVALGNVSIFSSLSSTYGYNALDNSILISNIINWLISADNEISGEAKILSVPINYSLALWMEKMVSEKKWDKLGDIINFSIKYFKDNYTRVIDEAKERRKKLKELREKRKAQEKERLEKQNLERTSAIEDIENSLLDLVEESDEGDPETLDDIMKELSKFNDEKK